MELLAAVKRVSILEKDEWKMIQAKYDIQVLRPRAAKIGGCWIPLSQIRGDTDTGIIYVARWFYQKELRGRLK